MLNMEEYIIFYYTEWVNKQLTIAHSAKLETIIRNQQVMEGGSESFFCTMCSQILQVIIIHTALDNKKQAQIPWESWLKVMA